MSLYVCNSKFSQLICSGSDAASIQTRATLSDDGKHFLLNGSKVCVFWNLYQLTKTCQNSALFPGSSFPLLLLENERPWKDPIWSLKILDFWLNGAGLAFKGTAHSSELLFLKPIKIDSAMELSRVPCFVKHAHNFVMCILGPLFCDFLLITHYNIRRICVVSSPAVSCELKD